MAEKKGAVKRPPDDNTYIVKPPFTQWEHKIINSVELAETEACAVKLMFQLSGQLKAKNNGHLKITWPMFKHKGWKSNDTLTTAKRHLLSRKWLVLTRQGGRHQCSLYGFTFLPIYEGDDKLDIKPGSDLLGLWRKDGGSDAKDEYDNSAEYGIEEF